MPKAATVGSNWLWFDSSTAIFGGLAKSGNASWKRLVKCVGGRGGGGVRLADTMADARYTQIHAYTHTYIDVRSMNTIKICHRMILIDISHNKCKFAI